MTQSWHLIVSSPNLADAQLPTGDVLWSSETSLKLTHLKQSFSDGTVQGFSRSAERLGKFLVMTTRGCKVFRNALLKLLEVVTGSADT